MNNDLISREALKIIIEQSQLVNAKLSIYDVLKIIDNAPTVNTTFREVVAYECGQKSVEIPQGKWIDGYCNKCGGSSLCDGWGRDVESNFCPNCGAKMRKGDPDCMDEDAKQASIPYTYNAPQHDWKYWSKCGYPEGEWIPVKYRPLTGEERISFAEHYGIEYCDTVDEKAFDCLMPEDGQEILVSRSWGVSTDVADNDIDGKGFIVYGLEGNGDWEGIDAWMPLPKPYKEAENE